MQYVRMGIIGLGNIGRHHADYLSNKKVSRCELVAVCDTFAPLDRYRPLQTFTDGAALIQSGAVDAVIIGIVDSVRVGDGEIFNRERKN